MNTDKLPNHFVYTPNVIEFVTVTAETCLFLEHAAELSRQDFVSKAVKILPLLYLKTTLLETPEPVFDDIPERFVTEEDYLFVREQVEGLLGEADSYLETSHPDIALSDTPIAAFVSEDLADIYQELKDFAANYQLADTDVMNDALAACLEAFGQHWGQKLLNALSALHALRFGDYFADESDEVVTNEKKSVNRDSFLNFQQEEADDEELSNFLK